MTVSTNNATSGIATNTPAVRVQTGVGVLKVGLNGTTDSVSAGGLLTFSKALPSGTYFGDNITGGVWVRLPAGMVSGRGAGLHFGIQKSTTTIQLYDLFVSDLSLGSKFVPYYPGTLPATAVGTATAVAQSSGTIYLMGATIPANSLGPNGMLRITTLGDGLNCAGTVDVVTVLPGPTSLKGNTWSSGLSNILEISMVYMRGNLARAITYTQGYQTSWGGNPGASTPFSFDNNQDQVVNYYASTANTTDHFALNGFTVETLFQ